ncbi:unnamed protein product [Prorocentrum cordatum]|uniref:Phospholipase A(2) n=1 Tax=Prorocentrum cordatum TaxID=2364126 RepID=A0ABN9Q488_9DINO|nr:unnamed protein product [Polarella glacialis]
MFKTTCDCCLAVQSDRIFFVWAPCRGAGHSNAAPHSAKCHCRNSSCVDCDRSASWWQVGMGPAGYALQCGAGVGPVDMDTHMMTCRRAEQRVCECKASDFTTCLRSLRSHNLDDVAIRSFFHAMWPGCVRLWPGSAPSRKGRKTFHIVGA